MSFNSILRSRNASSPLQQNRKTYLQIECYFDESIVISAKASKFTILKKMQNETRANFKLILQSNLKRRMMILCKEIPVKFRFKESDWSLYSQWV